MEVFVKRMKILFVNENYDSLNDLRNLLKNDTDRWDISYVEDGLSAIGKLESDIEKYPREKF